MKITCSQEDLARGLAAVKAAVANRSTLPIFMHIFIDARALGRRVRFAATDLDVGIHAWVSAV